MGVVESESEVRRLTSGRGLPCIVVVVVVATASGKMGVDGNKKRGHNMCVRDKDDKMKSMLLCV